MLEATKAKIEALKSSVVNPLDVYFEKEEIDDEAAKLLAEVLVGKNIYKINLSQTNLTPNGFNLLVPIINANANTLTHLDLSNLNIDLSLLNVTKLEELTLKNCQIGEAKVPVLTDLIEQNPSLKKIYLDKNLFDLNATVLKKISSPQSLSLLSLASCNLNLDQLLELKKRQINDGNLTIIATDNNFTMEEWYAKLLQLTQIEMANFSEKKLEETKTEIENKFIASLEKIVDAEKAEYQKKLDAIKEEVDEKIAAKDKVIQELENKINSDKLEYQTKLESLKTELVENFITDKIETQVEFNSKANAKFEAEILERKTELEKTKTEILEKYIAENTKINAELEQQKQTMEALNKKLIELEAREKDTFSTTNQGMLGRLENVEVKIGEIKIDIEKRFKNVEEQIIEVKKDIQNVEVKMDDTKKDIEIQIGDTKKDIKTGEEFKNEMLFAAIKKNHIKSVLSSLEVGSSLTALDSATGRTPFDLSLENTDYKIAEMLIREYPEVLTYPNKEGLTPLQAAVKDNQTAKSKWLWSQTKKLKSGKEKDKELSEAYKGASDQNKLFFMTDTLWDSVKAGDLKGVISVLEKNEMHVDINMLHPELQETPLHIAISYKHDKSLIRYLLSKGADPFALNHNSKSAFELACASKDYDDVIQLLCGLELSRCITANDIFGFNKTLLTAISVLKNPSAILGEYNFDIFTPLHLIAKTGNLAMFQQVSSMLAEKNISLELAYANSSAELKSSEVAEVDSSLESKELKSIEVESSLESKLSDTNELLELIDAELISKLSNAYPLLKISDANKLLELIDGDLLIKLSDAYPALKLTHADTLLELINADLLSKLSDACPLLELPDADGNTALHFAVQSNSHSLVEKLLEWNASIQAANKEGQIPLHKAVLTHIENESEASMRIIQLVIRMHASLKFNIAAKDKKDNTPYKVAIDHGNEKLAHRLSSLYGKFKERYKSINASENKNFNSNVNLNGNLNSDVHESKNANESKCENSESKIYNATLSDSSFLSLSEFQTSSSFYPISSTSTPSNSGMFSPTNSRNDNRKESVNNSNNDKVKLGNEEKVLSPKFSRFN